MKQDNIAEQLQIILDAVKELQCIAKCHPEVKGDCEVCEPHDELFYERQEKQNSKEKLSF